VDDLMPLGIARGIILVMMLLLGLLPLLIINASLLAISLCRLHRVTASTQFGRTPETLDVERCRIGCNQNVAAS